jgi:hypothetical protein
VKDNQGGDPDRPIYGLVPTLARVSSLNGDLALAVAFDDGSHLALSPARDVRGLLRGVLDRGAEIAGSRVVAACLTFDADPGLALQRAREVAGDVGADTAVADSPDLLALLAALIEALRDEPNAAAKMAVNTRRANRMAGWLVRTRARLFPPTRRGPFRATCKAAS